MESIQFIKMSRLYLQKNISFTNANKFILNNNSLTSNFIQISLPAMSNMGTCCGEERQIV